MKDWVGTARSIFVCNGASNHSLSERESNDYYATEPKAVELLLKNEKFAPKIWECACGGGHMSEVLKSHGFEVVSSDIIDRGYSGTQLINFLNVDFTCDCDIITNPPYRYAKEFVEQALKVTQEGAKVAMFLKLTFLEGQARRKMFEKYPPKVVYVSSARLQCAKNGEFEKYKNNAQAYAWFVWENGYKGFPIIKWL